MPNSQQAPPPRIVRKLLHCPCQIHANLSGLADDPQLSEISAAYAASILATRDRARLTYLPYCVIPFWWEAER